MPSASASQRRVEPSTSVNRKVTTPEGASAVDTRTECHTYARGGAPRSKPGRVTMENVTTVIVVTVLVLLALGIVINGLLRMRTWLKNSPPLPQPPDEDSD
jgi:hypothetical protein